MINAKCILTPRAYIHARVQNVAAEEGGEGQIMGSHFLFAHFSIANREHLTTVFGEANTFSYKKIGTVKIDVL